MAIALPCLRGIGANHSDANERPGYAYKNHQCSYYATRKSLLVTTRIISVLVSMGRNIKASKVSAPMP